MGNKFIPIANYILHIWRHRYAGENFKNACYIYTQTGIANEKLCMYIYFLPMLNLSCFISNSKLKVRWLATQFWRCIPSVPRPPSHFFYYKTCYKDTNLTAHTDSKSWKYWIYITHSQLMAPTVSSVTTGSNNTHIISWFRPTWGLQTWDYCVP